MLPMPSRGLYAITQTEGKTLKDIITHTEAVLKGGATLVQYRDKNPIDAMLLGRELVNCCHHYHVPLIINDDIHLAAAVNADGVHLGKEDGDIPQARKILGDNAIIGLSCYNSLDDARMAQDSGASYVAFGCFFPSISKPYAQPAQINTLIQARKVLSIPIVAIGGILPENGQQLIEAGADLLAVIGGLCTHQPQQTAQHYVSLFR
jgi:thiamine-phosphate pyrophosphorylase